jgi:peptidoglycan/xylan/chitin deacetylase (PgdA/CDA1 family)
MGDEADNMKKKLIRTITFLIVILAAGTFLLFWGSKFIIKESQEIAAAKNGLRNIDGKYYYYEKDKPVTDTLRRVSSGGRTSLYYFQADGSAYTDGYRKVTVNGKTGYFYFRKDGRAVTNGLKKVKINGKSCYFYFDRMGRAVTDRLQKVRTADGSTETYYFGKSGRAVTGRFVSVDDKKYFFGRDGRAYTDGRYMASHYLCYFDGDGAITRRIDANGKLVALTYDDGPSQYTETLLDTMEEYGAVCTFFIVGSRVDWYPDTVKRAAELGCQMGNHTYGHQYLDKLDTDEEVIAQIEDSNDEIEDASGVRPKVLRTPGGRTNDHINSIMGMPNILWSVDTRDWETKDTDSTIANVESDVKDGSIVLMHDLYESTCNAAATIVPWLLEQGFQTVTIDEMAACRGVTLENGERYYSMYPQN